MIALLYISVLFVGAVGIISFFFGLDDAEPGFLVAGLVLLTLGGFSFNAIGDLEGNLEVAEAQTQQLEAEQAYRLKLAEKLDLQKGLTAQTQADLKVANDTIDTLKGNVLVLEQAIDSKDATIENLQGKVERVENLVGSLAL